MAAVVACGGDGASGVSSPPPVPPASAPATPPAPQHSPDSVILFDQGHFNYHGLTTTYNAFANDAKTDGWIVEAIAGSVSRASLNRGRVLVIVSALSPVNYPNTWRLPTPSAFSASEIDTLRQWVREGGGLLLITDHMPFAGAAMDVASAFGASFSNGFAFDRSQLALPNPCLRASEVHVFSRSQGTLGDHVVTTGVNTVATFTGSAFEFTGTPILTFTSTSISLEPTIAWQFNNVTERPVGGWRQGGVTTVDRGRVAIFGEAAMFSAQMCDPTTPMGMNHPLAADNPRLLRNLLRWLGGRAP